MTSPWWPIYKIKFSKRQMWFLIENLAGLKVGIYPPAPGASSGYDIDAGVKQVNYREPAQNKVLELAAEVECRLDLVMDYISGWDRPEERIKRR